MLVREKKTNKAYQWSFYFGGRPKHECKQVEYRQPNEGWKQAQQGEHRAQSHIPAGGLEKALTLRHCSSRRPKERIHPNHWWLSVIHTHHRVPSQIPESEPLGMSLELCFCFVLYQTGIPVNLMQVVHGPHLVTLKCDYHSSKSRVGRTEYI